MDSAPGCSEWNWVGVLLNVLLICYVAKSPLRLGYMA